MEIILVDDYGHKKRIKEPNFFDEEFSFFDFIASNMNPCGNCGLLVLLESIGDEEDGTCKYCLAKEEKK